MPYQLSKFRPPVPCELCGLLIPQRTGRRSVRFCSKVCSGKATGGPAHWKSRTSFDQDLPIEDRFWARVKKTDTCWLWTGSRLPLGYGVLGRKDRGERRANRIAWELASGEPIPSGYVVCHVCDNPPCIRNDDAGTYEVNGVSHPRYGHLFLATMKDNSRDMIAKGRHWTNGHPGETNGYAKLTENAVREIRRRASNGERGKKLAIEFNISSGHVSAVVLRRAWRHVH